MLKTSIDLGLKLSTRIPSHINNACIHTSKAMMRKKGYLCYICILPLDENKTLRVAVGVSKMDSTGAGTIP